VEAYHGDGYAAAKQLAVDDDRKEFEDV